MNTSHEPLGQVYSWVKDARRFSGGYVEKITCLLPHIDRTGRSGLSGKFVTVRNAAVVKERDAAGNVQTTPLGNAKPDANGDFLYEPGHGGESGSDHALDVGAVHFGEVNAYYHVDRIASYIDRLLNDLGLASLAQVTVVVNAHQTLQASESVKFFTGGHYRLPSWKYDIPETEPISPHGEVHLGSSTKLLKHGALVEYSHGPYRKNVSHLADIIYHEYGHHVNRHTCDIQANDQRPLDRQSNRKAPIDEGTCDYWTAVMLETPHIWAWHKRHDERRVHPRSLASSKTMADYDPGRTADPHLNGTIWAAALWNLREKMGQSEAGGGEFADKLLLKSLDQINKIGRDEATPRKASRARESFEVGLACLREADRVLYSGRHERLILDSFSMRGIKT